MSTARLLPTVARNIFLLGATAFLPMCGSDSHPHDALDSGATPDSGAPAIGDSGADAGHLGSTPTSSDASLDSGSAINSDAAAGDANVDASTTPPDAPWHLWVMETTSHHLYGYAPSQLTSTNGDAPAIDIALEANLNSLHFDAQGNLWATALETTVVQYAAADLKHSGTATPRVKFTETTSGSLDYVAFDKAGNLWTSGHNTHPVNRYDAASLSTLTATSPAQTPTFKLTLSAPSEIAFDPAGNLYGTFYPGSGRASAARYDAAQLQGTGAVGDAPAALLANVTFYATTFFSPSGQLLFSCDADKVYRLSAAQVAATGNTNQSVTAETTFTITNLNAGWGAYDPNGVLWLSGRGDHFVAISAADLAKTGDITVTTPAVTIRAPVTNVGTSFTSIAIH